MHVKRRRLPNFESCSVALFTSLALGGAALPARSQVSLTPSVTSSAAAARATPRAAAGAYQIGPAATQTGAAMPANRWAPEQLAQAFRRTDSNGDGQLSREEAGAWTGLSRNFDDFDGNKDGSISSAEFDEALK